MYIIESGAVDILLAARGKEPIAQLGPGEVFGEMSMLDDQPRFASAVTREPTRLLKVERAALPELLGQNVRIAIAIMRKLAQRHQRCEMLLTDALAEAARQRPRPAAAAATMERADPPRASASAAPAASPPPKPAAAPSPARVPEPAPAPGRAAPAAVAAAKASGRCLLRHAQGESFPLDPGISEFLVGRPDPAAGINPEINLSGVDPTRSLSRRHAKLVRQGQLYFVREETGTVNGTFVNNVRVTTGVDVPIKPGDKLRFGAVEVDFAAA
jgi:predicted component of type VI protein secretion system